MTGHPFALVYTPQMAQMAHAIVNILKTDGFNLPAHEIELKQFANGELLPRLPKTVRRQQVYFLHGFSPTEPHADIFSMLLVNDALKLASVAGITLVLPYMPYLRQDRKDKPRVPISARTLADLIQSNRLVNHIITIDMHVDQAQGFFSIPVDNLTARPFFVEHFKRLFGTGMRDVVVVSPDFGDAKRARSFAKKLGDVPVTIFEKERAQANQSTVVGVIGADVAGKRVVIYDDMIDTGGTMRGVMQSLKDMGAVEVHVCTTHGILSQDASTAFKELGLPVGSTNTIQRSSEYLMRNPWLTIHPIDDLLAEAIREASTIEGSLSEISSR